MIFRGRGIEVSEFSRRSLDDLARAPWSHGALLEAHEDDQDLVEVIVRKSFEGLRGPCMKILKMPSIELGLLV